MAKDKHVEKCLEIKVPQISTTTNIKNRKKGCDYSLSHDVVTCDVDRDVSTAYC